MHESYLEVTFRHGQPLAAYLYLPGAGFPGQLTKPLDEGAANASSLIGR